MKIHLPPETWTNVFLFLDRKLLAIRSEQLNNRKICELLVWCIHETWLRSRQLNDIIICSPDCTEAAVLDPLKKLWPIAETPVPLNIVSFKQIWIRIFDGRVLEFFLQLRPLLAAVSVTLWIDNNQMYSHKAADQNLVVLCHLLPLVRSINSIYFRCITDFSNLFRHLIAFKEQLLQVRTLQFHSILMSHVQNSQLFDLLDWLESGSQEKAKMLRIGSSMPSFLELFVRSVRTRFLTAKQCHPFVCFIYVGWTWEFDEKDEQFKCLKNRTTGEQLLFHHQNPTSLYILRTTLDPTDEESIIESLKNEVFYFSNRRNNNFIGLHSSLSTLRPIQPINREEPVEIAGATRKRSFPF